MFQLTAIENSVYLRRWRKGDEFALAKHANSDLVFSKVRDAFPHPYTLQDAKNWIEFVRQEEPVFNFCIEVDGEAAGSIGIVLKTDIHRKNAEVGYWLGEAFWGRGVATAALKVIAKYAFDHFDIVRLYAHTFAENKASKRVLQKAGFEKEGYFKKAIIKKGKLYDEEIWAYYP